MGKIARQVCFFALLREKNIGEGASSLCFAACRGSLWCRRGFFLCCGVREAVFCVLRRKCYADGDGGRPVPTLAVSAIDGYPSK